MRICLIAHTDSPWAPHYAAFLHARGHDVHVISFHPDPLPGVTVHYVGLADRSGRLPKWLYFRRVPTVRRILRHLRPDVTLATYVQSNGVLGALTKIGPLIISTRGADHHFHLPAWLNAHVVRWIGRKADLLHASSPELVDGFSELGVPRDKFTIIPLGTDSRLFFPLEAPRPPGVPRLICTRKHEPLYANETIVRAAALLRDQGVKFQLRFVGKGSTLSETTDLAARLDLGDCIEFAGGAPQSDIPPHLRWADLYLSAARSDGAPSSLFEAMATRLFPIVTDVRANRDWLRHMESGWLYPVGDAAACAEGVRWALANPEVRNRAGQLNRSLVVERLDRDRNLVLLEELLSRAAAMR